MADEIIRRLLDFSEQYLASEKVPSSEFFDCLLTRMAEICGEAHIPGMVAYIMEHQEQIHDPDFVITLSCSWLYPEVNDLLLSQDEQEVQWALTLVRALPYEYYLPNLNALQSGPEKETKQVAEMIALCQAEKINSPRPDLG